MILGCCEGLADYHCGLHSLESPVNSSSGSRLQHPCGPHSSEVPPTSVHHPTSTFTGHFGPKRGALRAENWRELESQPSGRTEIFYANDGKGVVSSDSSDLCLETEGIVLHIDLPCSPPCKDSAEFLALNSSTQERSLAIEREGQAISAPTLPRGSHEQLKMTSQAEVSQRSEAKIPSNLGTHVLRALLETDNVQRFTRWRQQVTPNDQNPGSMQDKPETEPSLEMSASPVKDGFLVREEKVGLAEPDFLSPDADDHLRPSHQGDLASDLEKMESTVLVSLGTHALRSLFETDDIQKFKRRRFTTPVKDLKEISEKNSPVFARQTTVSRESKCLSGSLVSPGSDGLQVSRSSAVHIIENDVDHAEEATDLPGPPADYIKGKSDIQSDSSSGSLGSHSLERDTLDFKYITRPPRYSVGSTDSAPRKKEWLGQHHGGKVESGIAQDAGFAGNVGGCYRSAIDKRPAAPHPGFVGDGATVQYCRICGEREDSTSSLICDSCEEVFHMTCVNARMKIVPRVDEWLCRPCKKKRKMSREGENLGDSDTGAEPKDWWREDSGIGKIERELLRMSNGKRMKVRMGPKYQADVPEWAGAADVVDLDDTLAETSDRFGYEVPLTAEEKQREQEQAKFNLEHSKWPRGWLPATELPLGAKQNWLQCMLVLFDEGDICPDGHKAERDIICGKWRRAPLDTVTDDQWECSCALEWDPRHADCAVPQELSTEEINERMKFAKITEQQASVMVQ